jgi:hypothetical protein
MFINKLNFKFQYSSFEICSISYQVSFPNGLRSNSFHGEFSPFGDFLNSLKNHNSAIFAKNRKKI